MNFTFSSKDYSNYFQSAFRFRWLRPQNLQEQLRAFRNHPDLKFATIGNSTEGRKIESIEFGEGAITVCLWSQMHGNEPTATMALIDLLAFLTANDDYNALRDKLKKSLKLSFIPMLNPDGSEAFTRVNALGIDLNRDARSQASLEMGHFVRHIKVFKPQWAFNLHDQRAIFSVGATSKPATFSFLAAAASKEEPNNKARKRAMTLIAHLAELVETELPKHVAKYSDAFYPRALGEHFMENDIPCVLIESGAHPKDDYRDTARRLNFLSLLYSLELLADGLVANSKRIEEYHQIPENEKNHLDLILRNCELQRGETTTKADIGLMRKEVLDHETDQLQTHFILEAVGDLSEQYGLVEQMGGVLNADTFALKLQEPAHFILQIEERQTLIFEKGLTENLL